MYLHPYLYPSSYNCAMNDASWEGPERCDPGPPCILFIASVHWAAGVICERRGSSRPHRSQIARRDGRSIRRMADS